MDRTYSSRPGQQSRLRVHLFEERPGSRWRTVVEWYLDFDLTGTKAGFADALTRFHDQWRSRGRLLDFADDWSIFLPTSPYINTRGTIVARSEQEGLSDRWVSDAWAVGNADRRLSDKDSGPGMLISLTVRIYRPGRRRMDRVSTSDLITYTRSVVVAVVGAFGDQVAEGVFDYSPELR